MAENVRYVPSGVPGVVVFWAQEEDSHESGWWVGRDDGNGFVSTLEEDALRCWNEEEALRQAKVFGTSDRIVTILAARLEEFKHELDKLVRKAHRYGNPDIGYRVDAVRIEKRSFTDWDGETRASNEKVVDLIIFGKAPRIGDHEFLARIQWEDGRLMMDKSPEATVELDKRFRTTDARCEHCGKVRTRNEVFVVLDRKTGEQKQIGRSCLRDYMGIDDPARLAHRFDFWESLRAGSDEDEGWGRGKEMFQTTLVSLLSLASTCVRLFGWASRGQAQNDRGVTATAEYVGLFFMEPKLLTKDDVRIMTKVREAHNDDDKAVALETIEWVRSLGDDPEGDYLFNLSQIFRSEVLNTKKRIGLTISAIAAMMRAKERAIQRTKEYEKAKLSSHVGSIGERLKGIVVTQLDQRTLPATDFGPMVLIKLVDDNGNIFSWFTSKGTGRVNGEKMTMDATVKKHGDYKGIKETQISRAKLSALVIDIKTRKVA